MEIPVRNPVPAVAALGLALGCAACTGHDTPAPSAAPAASPTAAAASGDAALSANTKAICGQAERAGSAFGDTFLADLKLQLDAKSKDARARADAEHKISRDVADYSVALAGMAKLAADPALKSALKQMSGQVTAFAGDVSKINATRMSQLSDTLDRACGKG